jgi:hypothetical protein
LLALSVEFGVLGLEGVGNVFEEDQAQDDVLIFRRVHVVAQRIGRGPKLRLEAQIGAAAVVLVGRPLRCFRHSSPLRTILAQSVRIRQVVAAICCYPMLVRAL